MHILHVVGARPNFMKAAPVMRALGGRPGVNQSLVHTGQHYDFNMSGVFFAQLGIPAPDVNLEVGAGSYAQQTAAIMTGFESVVLERKPDLVLVYGDVNSTVAAALVCSKLMIRIGHVEAGLRSFDRAMPEEINRLLTDQMADFLFTPSADGDCNLLREGVPAEKIFRVGNVMIDSLVHLLPEIERCKANGVPSRFALVTLHRPSNVDDEATLKTLVTTLQEINQSLHIVFPVHPRTRRRIAEFGIDVSKFHLLDPMPYLEFLSLTPARRGRNYRFRRHPGRDHLPEYSLSDAAQQHGAACHGGARHQCVGGPGLRQAQGRSPQDRGREGKDGDQASVMGWLGQRTHCRHC